MKVSKNVSVSALKVSVSVSSRSKIERSRSWSRSRKILEGLGLVSDRNPNVSVSSRSRRQTSRLQVTFLAFLSNIIGFNCVVNLFSFHCRSTSTFHPDRCCYLHTSKSQYVTVSLTCLLGKMVSCETMTCARQALLNPDVTYLGCYVIKFRY